MIKLNFANVVIFTLTTRITAYGGLTLGGK